MNNVASQIHEQQAKTRAGTFTVRGRACTAPGAYTAGASDATDAPGAAGAADTFDTLPQCLGEIMSKFSTIVVKNRHVFRTLFYAFKDFA